MSSPSVRELKETRPDDAAHGINPQQTELLQDVLASKGVNPHAVALLTSHDVAGQLIDTYLLGNRTNGRAERNLNSMAWIAAESLAEAEGSYTGSPEENEAIIAGDYRSTFDREGFAPRDSRRNGANRDFHSGRVEVNRADEALGTTFAPIAIVGGGPAGILTGRALRDAGFRNITIFDSAGRSGGIWTRSNVREGTKNNPFIISFDGRKMLPPGQDSPPYMMRRDPIKGSGQDVTMFVGDIKDGYHGRKSKPRLRVVQGHIKDIEPGDLSHTLTVVSGGKEEKCEFPIVIYAPGVGEPVPLSDENRMVTPNRSAEAGRRWQQQLTREELEDLASKKVVLIGLGNSTAEMLFQFQNFEDETGTNIDYRVLTHYPDSALQRPHQSIFRNIKEPDLVKFAGDLKHVESLYWRAMHQGKIIGGVKEWARDEGKCKLTLEDGQRMELPVDEMYTLIGYRQRPGVLKHMGIQVIDENLGIGAYDFDGEIQRAPGAHGRDRLHPGFFAIGPIVKTPYNPNAMVIPGIQYQLNDLLPTVSLRAAEFALRPESQKPIVEARRAYFMHIIKRQAFIAKESFAAPAAGRGPNSPPPRY